MFKIIMETSFIIVAISIFGTYQSAAKGKKNTRMGITLPNQYLNHPEVLAIINHYKKRNTAIFILSLIATLPLFTITYTSFIILLMAVWIAVTMIISNECFNKYNSKLLLLKSKNQWFPLDCGFRLLTREETSLNKSNRFAFLRKWIPTMKDKLLSQTDEPIYVDEDEYWINGYYYNPDDKRAMVEKRIGYGLTGNLATKKGKWSVYGSGAFGAFVFIAVFILFVRMDFATFQMEIGESTVVIKAPLYDYQFEIDNIEEVTLTDILPQHGIRTNGTATETYYLGNFNFDEYGSSKVFIYIDNPPYLIIWLNDKTVLFNTKSEEKTKQYYVQLLNQMENLGSIKPN
ncbi:MAG: hypothetical protein ACYDEX_05695 [Mobilitalea sp.]